jgi:GNAT superfamily N-acetyltransferase
MVQPGEGQAVERMLATVAAPRPGLAHTIDHGQLITGYEVAECYLVACDRDSDSIIGALAASPPMLWLRTMGKHGMPEHERQLLAQVIAKVHSIVVDAAYRRHGVGRKLLLSATAFYRSREYQWLYGQFRDDELVPFYESLGFEISEPNQDLIVPIGSVSRGMHGDSGERWFSTLL